MENQTLYNIVLIAHLFGVFLLLIALSIMLVAIVGLRRATTVQGLRGPLYAGPAIKKIMPIATLIIPVAGIWMAFMKDPDYNWHSAWIVYAFFLFWLMSINGAVNIGQRMAKLGIAAATTKDGPLPPKLAKMAADPLLHYPAWINVGLVFAFVVLMVGKPGWLGSLIAVLAGAILGAMACWLVARWGAASAQQNS